VDLRFGRTVICIDCIFDDQLSINKSSNCQSCEEFENGVNA
jgi:hypothetical protein